QYRAIKDEIDEAIQRVLDTSAFVLGREVESFERAFADYVGARECVGVSNGTAAIQLALTACGVGQGQEVIVPANTFFATAEAVSTAGATPVFVDCDADSYTIDPNKIESAISERTRAIIPVHLYGQPADLDSVFEIAARHRLVVIEDAAQAHGALYRGRRVGAPARAGCFSFYPGKNLGAYGEGGRRTATTLGRRERADPHTLPRARPPATGLRRARPPRGRLPSRRRAVAPRALAPDVRRVDQRTDRTRRGSYKAVSFQRSALSFNLAAVCSIVLAER